MAHTWFRWRTCYSFPWNIIARRPLPDDACVKPALDGFCTLELRDNIREECMNEIVQQRIHVTGAKGQKAVITEHPNPSKSLKDKSEAGPIYAMDGLTVERISPTKYKDFRGEIWNAE